MTRKDYVRIAEAIFEVRFAIAQHGGNMDAVSGVRATAEAIADVLQADNPRFNRWRFLLACGLAD